MISDSEEDERFTGFGEAENEASEDQEEEDEVEGGEEEGRVSPELRVKKKKPGVVYLSSVPDGMNVSQTTAFFSEFGRVGRIFLQPDKTDKQRGKYNRVFSEGWVEFLSKKVARGCAERLNSQPVGGKRRSKAFDQTWNLKYLPRFKWVHLSERLAYEAAVRQQRLRTEISQVKREAEHFKSAVESKRKKSKTKKAEKEGEGEVGTVEQPFLFRQKETEAQIRKRKVEDEPNNAAPEVKKKKAKKAKAASKAVEPEKSKSKKSNKSENRVGVGKVKSKEGGDRSALLKSVFGGGGP